MSFKKFKDLKDKDESPSASTTTASRSDGAVLGAGSKVVGKLQFEGPVELSGEVEGEIFAKKSLKIAETAEIKANIEGSEIIVYGTVTGDINASISLSLRTPAKVSGNISAKSLNIETGVFFDGACTMKNNAEKNNAEKTDAGKPSNAASNSSSTASSSSTTSSKDVSKS